MPGFGVCLGGGGVLCAAELGMLGALQEWGVKPTVVAGSSGGGIIAGALGAGVPLDALTATLRIVCLRPERYGLGVLPAVEDVFREDATPGLWSLRPALEALLLPATAKTVDEWAPGYGVVATDMGTGGEAYFSADRPLMDQVPTIDALQATSAFPGLLAGTRPFGSLLSDGGLLDNVPGALAVRLGADRLLAVSFDHMASAAPARLSPLDVLYRGVIIAVQAAQHPMPDVPTVMLRYTLPPGAGLLAYAQFEALVQAGHAAAVGQKDDIMRLAGERGAA